MKNSQNETADINLSEGDRRSLGIWAAACATRVLPLFEAKAPSDNRPRAAIGGIEVFAGGGKRTAPLRALAWAAHAAAREVEEPAATAAARAASIAAAVAYIHARATPHQLKHALGAPVYAARAHELATSGDRASGDSEIQWALEHASPTVREVVSRFPIRAVGRSRLDTLFYQLDAGLRS